MIVLLSGLVHLRHINQYYKGRKNITHLLITAGTDSAWYEAFR